ncbi:MAG: prolipoprotein diacylglyceryl transferase [Myxococcales bacterium]|nr:prolipoprotein diacylglyceryl transferase [Myxococcales bacterium]
MHPTLVRVFDQPVPAYFTMLMVGFGLATWLAARLAGRMGLDRDTIIDLGLFSVLFGVAGGRLMHVFADGYFWDYVHLCTDPSLVGWHISAAQCGAIGGRWDAAATVCRPIARDCFAWAKFWNGGLTYYGGLLAAGAFGLWFLRRERFPVLKGVDLVGMGIALGLAFGRMGCFLAGCCFGSVSHGPLSFVFPPWSPASEEQFRAGLLHDPGLASLPVYPTQLAESVGCAIIAAFLYLWLHPRKRFDGEVMLAFLGLYAALRFVLEFFRADARGTIEGLSTSQFFGVVIVGFVVVAWPWLRRRAKRLAAAAAARHARDGLPEPPPAPAQ